MRQMMSRRQALAGIGVAGSGLAAATACGSVAAATGPAVRAARDQSGGKLLWRARGASPGDDEPRILTAPGRVYTTGGGRYYGDSGICAFDAATGREAWRTPGASGSRPLAAGPGAVFGFTVRPGGGTVVVATSAATGRTLWAHDTGRLLD